jgi:hypothetical protein
MPGNDLDALAESSLLRRPRATWRSSPRTTPLNFDDVIAELLEEAGHMPAQAASRRFDDEDRHTPRITI